MLLRTALLFLFLLSATLACAQVNFGFKIGSTFYQPSLGFTVGKPRPGAEAQFMTRFQLGQRNTHRLMIDVGYVMANNNSPVNRDNFISKYSGQQIPADGQILDAHAFLHFLNLGAMYQFTPWSDDIVNFYLGVEYNQLFSWTHIVKYTTSANPNDQIQETWSDSPKSIQQQTGVNIPTQYFNIRYGVDISMFRSAKHDYKLYLNLANQVNHSQYPFLPVAGFIGMKVYFNALSH